ncbi:HAD-IA family hydrolase [Yoonia sediminilitoris]|uniref:Phosphoglycolate phosphatase n=1 Tax=Yoonia sediminilitoris TaxID=1286148 RepID=A0A2T6KPE7_9RHOB|nr:HAD-IA family hydrolase [Yoonia sediminilitoris]PUB18422.1 phosphoglycolate phosphatase [Yoonia sediminilitoris]RCW98590.1 phosphoglycolate phosphatase [Yoonia sediminilitoris]
MSDLRLVIFDVDGTLVDSQAEIVAAMTSAFAGEGLDLPDRQRLLSIVGLSLDEAFIQLCPDSDAARRARLVAGYKNSYMDLRDSQRKFGPMFPGAMDVLQSLAAQEETFLAVATGKSRRGLDKLLEYYELTGFFHSEQVSDHHPSKPNPSMILTALNDTGVDAARTVMIGDTTFDMDMGRAAGVRTIGVSWGYHPADSLRPDVLIEDFAALPEAVDQLTGN